MPLNRARFKLDVPLTGLFGLLLKAVKDVYALRPHRQIEHSESTFRFMDPDLSNARTPGAHRLPIRRFLAALHLLELITGLSIGAFVSRTVRWLGDLRSAAESFTTHAIDKLLAAMTGPQLV